MSTRVKPTAEDYEARVADAMQSGRPGLAEYLANRFDRDYPAGDDA